MFRTKQAKRVLIAIIINKKPLKLMVLKVEDLIKVLTLKTLLKHEIV